MDIIVMESLCENSLMILQNVIVACTRFLTAQISKDPFVVFQVFFPPNGGIGLKPANCDLTFCCH